MLPMDKEMKINILSAEFMGTGWYIHVDYMCVHVNLIDCTFPPAYAPIRNLVVDL